MNDTVTTSIETGTILSTAYADFMNENSDKIPAQLQLQTETLPELLSHFEYPICAWPIMISQEKATRLADLSTMIPKLICQIPSKYFNDDTQKIADFYFGGNTMLAEYTLMCHHKNIEFGSRLDIIETANGFKILEVNMGSSIGGVEIPSFEPTLRNNHTYLKNGITSGSIKLRNTQEIYTKFLIDKVIKYVDAVKDEINIFLGFDTITDAKMQQEVIDFFSEIFTKELHARGKHGTVLLGNIASLQLGTTGLTSGSTQVHAVVVLDLAANHMSTDVLRAFITDQVYFPDHLGIAFMRDKRNLALVYELALQDKFSPSENTLILDAIPWTTIVTNKNVTYNGQTHNLSELLHANKDQFVVKIIDGLQGKDVYVGKYLTQEAWEQALSEAFKNNKYIAQEFCDAVSYKAPNKNNEWTSHDLIWGAFGFGSQYGGTWVRMSEKEKSSGVINSATGAVEALVYEMK